MNKQLFSYTLGLAILGLGLLSSCNGGAGSSAKTLTSVNGFEYIHHTQNEGAKAQVGEFAYFQVKVFVDDSLLQSSWEDKQKPKLQIPDADQAKLQPNPIIDVLPLMSVGDSLTVSQSLDSFPQRPPGFEKFSNLIYRVSLTEIKTEEEQKVIDEEEQKVHQEKAAIVQARLEEVAASSTQVLEDFKAKKLDGQITKTASGLKYIVHEEGTGALPNSGELINVHYYGMLMDGTVFDNSFKRGEAFSFAVGQGQVIPGWDEGLALLKKGSKATLFIPYDIAYGEAGSPPVIPAKAELVFYVELLDGAE